jgi:hypothetical protein
MVEYKLIGLDKMEATKLRRKLDPPERWESSRSEPVTSLINKVFQACGCLLKIDDPRWETHVCPLYYYYSESSLGRTQPLYDRIFFEYGKHFSDVPELSRLRFKEYVGTVATAEIDLLIEDTEYFIFVEVKDPRENENPRFSKGPIHQLVRQYVQGNILAKLIEKRFMMATIKTGLSVLSDLKEPERIALAAVGHLSEDLRICDFDWDVFNLPSTPQL